MLRRRDYIEPVALDRFGYASGHLHSRHSLVHAPNPKAEARSWNMAANSARHCGNLGTLAAGVWPDRLPVRYAQ